MLITRLDAMHPAGDGVFCEFFRGILNARLRADALRVCGWEVDIYDEELGPLGDDQQCFLLQNGWPLLPTSSILEWFPMYLPVEVNAEQIFEVQQGGPSCRK